MKRQDSIPRLTSNSFLSIFFSCGTDTDCCSTDGSWLEIWPDLFFFGFNFLPLASPVPKLSIPELINIELEGKAGFSKKNKVGRAQEKLLQETSLSCTDLYFQSEFGRKPQFEDVLLLSSNALISLSRRSSASER
jgi:hypothetical protein